MLSQNDKNVILYSLNNSACLSKQQINNFMTVIYKLLPYFQKKYKNRFTLEDIEDAFNESLAKLNLNYIRDRLKFHHIPLTLAKLQKVILYLLALLQRILRYSLLLKKRKNDKLNIVNYGINYDQYPSSNLSTLEIIINQETNHNLQKTITKITTDEYFKTIHPKGYEQANISEIFTRRLNQQEWHKIAQSLNIPKGTLTAFWYRKVLPILQQQFAEFHPAN
ncbi:MAG TPA: hypothetical protein V6C58_26555 [Allocoleopsis sp.]